MATGTDPSTWAHDGALISLLFEDLSMLAFNGLNDTRLGCPAEHLVSHDDPPEDCCDFVAVWAPEWTPHVAGKFPVQLSDAEELRCLPVKFAAQIVLVLRRPCAPTITDNRDDPFPTPTAETAAAQDLLIDARALQCVVANTWLSRLAQTYPNPTQPRIFYEQMSSTGGITGCFGWDWPMKLELSGCSTGC